MNIITRSTCRLCNSDKIESIFSLGNLYISDFVEKKTDGRQAPLEMIYCHNCSLLQLKHTAPQELLYSGFYWYRSGVTETMKKALRNITENVESLIDLKEGDVVLDIGANDGTLLETYKNKKIVKIGCEPAKNLVDELNKRADHVINDFWLIENYEKLEKSTGIGKAKVITAIGMFYDMEDPNQFIRDVQLALDDDGIFIAQLMCLRQMLETNDLGNICHEHLEYYSLESLKFLFENNKLEIFKIEENEINGGSYRIFARHYKGTPVSCDEKFSISDYKDFFKRVNDTKEKCISFIKKEVANGKKVFVIGASTKGNTTLQYYGIDHTLVSGASERSPEKWGKYTVGTMIPIVSEEEARKANPDYFLVLPWAFFDEMYERESEWRKNGGKFIVPFPEFRIVE